MTRPKASHIRQALTSLLPRRRIRELARELGVVRRRRKLDIVALVYSLALGFSVGDRRTLAGLRRAYLRATGTRLAPSSFHARFCAGTVKLVRTLAIEALDTLARARPQLKSVLAPFVEVLAVDSALLRLHDALEPFYPSVWTHYMKASAKLTVVMNVVARGTKTVRLAHGSRHDRHLLQAGPWMKGRLLLFDLGFFRTELFLQIDRHGGYFLSRARKHANPTIVSCHRAEQRHLVGMSLLDALPRLDTDVLDVEAEMGYQRHHRRGPPHVTNHRARFRFVAVYNHEHQRWQGYVTNLPPALMNAEHFPAVYAARWEVELLFRELKGTYRIERMPSANKHVTEPLIYAALLSLALSRRIYHVLAPRPIDRFRMTLDRFATLLTTVAHDQLDLLLSRHDRAHRERRIARFLRAEAQDPNRARIPLPFRAQAGVLRAR
jgi:putative transposase